MDSFLGGGLNFGGSVPSYGDVGGGYTGDFFTGSGGSSGGGIGSAVLGGIGKGLLGGVTDLLSPQSSSGSSQRSSYVGQAQDRMRDLLALALSSFDTPKSTV